jgi:hypothetical protein
MVFGIRADNAIKIVVIWEWHTIIWYIGTIILEEHTAPIFRVEE